MSVLSAPRKQNGPIDELDAIRWFHRIDLRDGRVTPGIDDTATKLKQVRLPDDLTGKSVLDIGAWDGFFSFEAERRGAERVLAVDKVTWSHPEVGPRGFHYARQALGSRVESGMFDVLDLCPETVGTFDLVLFLGVLYHMPHPLLALVHVGSVTRHQLILETHVDLLRVDRPVIAYYAGSECANDPTNWCGPNLPALKTMLRTVGFDRVTMFPVTPVAYRVKGARRASDYGRVVVHAWKAAANP
jgi:tRNA (mo5U34)-methyltransferase